MALTDFLTDIANAIRSKDGTSAPIVANDFPQKILDIPSGGGLPDDMIIGDFTPQKDVSEYTITHGKSKNPKCIFVYVTEITGIYTMRAYLNISMDTGDEIVERTALSYTPYNSSVPAVLTNTNATPPTFSDERFTIYARSSTYSYKAGVTYHYILVF